MAKLRSYSLPKLSLGFALSAALVPLLCFAYVSATHARIRGHWNDALIDGSTFESEPKFDSSEDSGLEVNRQSVGCGHHNLNPGQSVTIKSKNYPGKHPIKHTCKWYFQGSSCDLTLSITCDVFQLQGKEYGCLTLKGGGLKTKSCNSVRKFKIESGNDKLEAHFVTRGKAGNGFQCTVTALDLGPNITLYDIRDSINVTEQSLQTSLQSTDDRVASLQTSLQSTDDRIASLQTSLQSTDDRVASLQTSLQSTDDRVASLQTSLQSTDDRIASLQTSLQSTDGRIASLQTLLKSTYDKTKSVHYYSYYSYWRIRDLQTSLQITDGRIVEMMDKIWCKEGWKYFQNSCYFFSTEELDWDDGLAACQDMTSDYVKISTEGEYNFIYNTIGDDSWVGLNDREVNDTYKWISDGTLLQNWQDSWWDSDQPDNLNGTVHCVSMGSGFYVDGCNSTYRYVCEMDDSQCLNFQPL